jgi:hypothetical protein
MVIHMAGLDRHPMRVIVGTSARERPGMARRTMLVDRAGSPPPGDPARSVALG